MPTRFGSRYKKEIADQSNLSFMPGYEARDFSAPDSDDVIRSLTLREVASGRQVQVRSRLYVLAAGTQETTRILLRNQQLFKNVGKVPPALGKYYQGHLSGKIASVHFSGNPNKTEYGFLRDDEGVYVRRRFQFSTKFLMEKNLLNTAIWLDNPLYFDPRHRSGAMSFMYLAMITPVLGKKLAPPAIAHSVTNGKVTAIHKHLLNILLGLPKSILTPATIFFKRYLLKRKLPGVFLYSPKNQYALHFHSEQIPNALNRMELGADGESLVIHYSLSDEDVRSVILLHEVLDKHLQESGCGKLEYWFNREELQDQIRKISRDGIHQSGTTRIGDSPEQGVVDANLKVWGTENLFICSSSVFPTSGQANPTFLIGAFGVRLAEHLKTVSINLS
jgi:choline dehydrogenase-like flavoprotein